MNQQQKIELLRRYADKIRANYDFYTKDDIPVKIIENAIKKYANGLDRNTVIGLFDTSISGNGKSGYVFTDTKVYYQNFLERPQKLWYDDIESVEIIDNKKKDNENTIVFNMYDGTTVSWTDYYLNKTPLRDFFKELVKHINDSNINNIPKAAFDELNMSGAIAGGVSAGAYNQVRKSWGEEKFHAAQGHGFAAERANHFYDKQEGLDVQLLDDNAKNGPDRVVNGVQIQSKYCQSGSKCISECFDKEGNFRYWSNGKPMQIEVPADKYDAAVQSMENKIRQGKLPGVTDPNEAKSIVRKGHFTYEQAKNIAKAGNVDSLIYDAQHGVIVASSAFGVTAIITLATNLWSGEDFEKSLKLATYSGLKVGGTAFITTILTGQLSRAGLNNALFGSSQAVIEFMGPKASAVLINAFRETGSGIYGAAAMKSAAKLLRGNVISAGVTVVVLSSFDVANIFRGRISGKQLFKNLANSASTVGGGTAGWLGGAAIGSALLPGLGTVVGGLIGSITVGASAGKVTNVVLGTFIEEDADEMVRIIQKSFEELSVDYLLSQKEAEKCIDRLSEKLDGKKLKDMFASKDRKEYAKRMLVPIIENETKKRKHIDAVSDDRLALSLRSVLEDISDSENFNSGVAFA